MTREDFLMETLNRLEFQECLARRQGHDTIAYDYVVAQRLLKNLYRSDELIDLDWLEHISK